MSSLMPAERESASPKTTTNASNPSKSPVRKKKRVTCTNCNRPQPRACICSSLPESLLSFQKCRVIVLQHPHEAKRKNASLPLVELCVRQEDLKVVIGRRLGEEVDENIMKLINSRNVMLVFPGPGALSLNQGIDAVKKRMREDKLSMSIAVDDDKVPDESDKRQGNDEKSSSEIVDLKEDKITLIFIDATWKFAVEMEKTNTAKQLWPEDIIRVQLFQKKNEQMAPPVPNSDPPSLPASAGLKRPSDDELPDDFKERRFNIRTPPSTSHLSTAESIAWVVSVVEKSSHIYQTIMKPLDMMVHQWNSFVQEKDTSREKRQKLLP